MAERVLIVGPVPGHLGSRSTGGIATHVLELAEALAAAGHAPAIYADNMPAAEDGTSVEWGPVFSARPLSKSVGGAAQIAANPVRAAETRRLMPKAEALGKRFGPVFGHVLGLSAAAEAHRPDVVHYHQPDMRLLYGRMAGLVDLPSVSTLHSLSAFADDAPAALSELVLENLRLSDSVIAVSEDVATGLGSIAPDISPVVIPNGVDLARFAPSAERTSAIGYVGRIAPGKGVDDLIAAMPRVREAVPEARLVLAGPVVDVDVDELVGAAGLEPHAVEVLGDLGPEEVARTLATIGVFALPSHLREGQPRSIIEAMGAGVPIVATRVGGIPGLIGDGAAELVEPGDVDALGNALIRLLTDPDRSAQLTTEARARAQEYDVGRTTEIIVGEYARARSG
jgi:glycosyltransferase involved in cell wall biosynthesis